MFEIHTCRICLKAELHLLETSNKSCDNITYLEQLTYCIPEIEKIDPLPSLICLSCVEVLGVVVNFKKLCITSHQTRKQYLASLDYKVGCSSKPSEVDKLQVAAESEALNNLVVDCNASSVNNLTCHACKKTFSSHKNLSRHLKAVHAQGNLYQCRFCSRGFKNKDILVRHVNQHTGDRNYVCSICGKRFFTNSDLNHHNQRHLNKREYKCGSCGKGFNTASNLRTHCLIVHVEQTHRKYLCTICGRKCVTRTVLNVHMKRHGGKKEFACHLCSKLFFTNSELLKHIPTHSNVKLYKCLLCSAEYKSKRILSTHVNKKHSMGCGKDFVKNAQ